MKAIQWSCLVSGVLLAATCCAAAPAAAGRQCRVPPGAAGVALPSELPPALSKAVGDVAMPGEPFDSIDVYVKGHKHSRYMFVWKNGNRWIVATERGGIALRAVVSVYAVRSEGQTPAFIEEHITFPASACATATGLVAK